MNNKPIQHGNIDEKKNITYEPLVSIITPILNQVGYVEECIQSVLNQSYPNIEHIFVDGVSTDGTLEVLASYKAKYPDRITFISAKDNSVYDAWNKGIIMSTGNILGWLGSDDTSPEGAIEAVVKCFTDHPDVSVVFGDCNVMDANGEMISRVYSYDFDLKRSITTACPLYTPAVFFKREVVDRIGLLDTALPASEFDYYIRAAKIFKLQRINKVLANFRLHKGGTTGSSGAMFMYAHDNYMVARKHGATLFSPRGRNYILMSLTRPIRPLVAFLYNSKRLKPVLAPVYYLIVGRQGKVDYFDNGSSS